MYIGDPWKKKQSEIVTPGPESKHTNEAKDGAIAWTSVSVPFYIAFVCVICKECAKISYFDFDLKNNTIYYINISVI